MLSGPAAESPEARAALADCRSRMGGFLTTVGKNAEALAAYRLARSDQEALADVPRGIAGSPARPGGHGQPHWPTAGEYRPAPGGGGRVPQGAGDPPGAGRRESRLNEFRSSLAASHNNLGLVLADTGRASEAEAEHRKALAIRQELAEENPAVSVFREHTGGQPLQPGNLLPADGAAVGGGGRVPHGPGDLAGAGRGEPRRHRIPQHPGDHPRQPRSPAVGHGPAAGGGGRVPHGAGDPRRNWPGQTPRSSRVPQRPGADPRQPRRPAGGIGPAVEAEAEFRAGLAIQQELADHNPAVTEFRTAWRPATSISATCCRRRAGRPRRSPSTARRGDLPASWPRPTPPSPIYRHDLAYTHDHRALLLSQAGRPSEAEAESRTAAATLPGPRRPQPQGPRLQRRSRLGAHEPRRYRPPRAAGRSRPATPTTGRSPSASGWSRITRRPRAYLGSLAASLRRRGLARRDLGDLAGATADARRAMGLLDGLPSRSRRGVVRDRLLPCRDGHPGRGGTPRLRRPMRRWPCCRRPWPWASANADAFRTETALDPLRGRDDFRLAADGPGHARRTVRPVIGRRSDGIATANGPSRGVTGIGEIPEISQRRGVPGGPGRRGRASVPFDPRPETRISSRLLRSEIFQGPCQPFADRQGVGASVLGRGRGPCHSPAD